MSSPLLYAVALRLILLEEEEEQLELLRIDEELGLYDSDRMMPVR